MANRPSQLWIPVKSRSYDNLYHGRFPTGNAPQILTGAAVAQAVAGANLRSGAGLAGGAAAAAAASGLLAGTSGTLAEHADWVNRSTGLGVVFAHNFENAAEVYNFSWANNVGNQPDPNTTDQTLLWDPTDGFAGGGNAMITIPTGGLSTGNLIRPFSALDGTSNGKGIADPAANGTLPIRSWDHSAGFDQPWNFRNGFYGHVDEQAAAPTWPNIAGATQTNIWDGTDFYIQLRVKFSSTRWQGGVWNGTPGSGNPPGKLAFIDITPVTGYQETVVRSPARWSWDRGAGAFDMYTVHGSFYGGELGNPQGPGDNTMQPGGSAAVCTLGHSTLPQDCWEWPTDQWVTLLFHFIPGKQNDFITLNIENILDCPFPDAGIEVFYCLPGQTNYSLLWRKLDYFWYYNSSGTVPNCFNAIKLSGYMNGVNSVIGWTQKYTQLIFSKQIIPCPQDGGVPGGGGAPVSAALSGSPAIVTTATARLKDKAALAAAAAVSASVSAVLAGSGTGAPAHFTSAADGAWYTTAGASNQIINRAGVVPTPSLESQVGFGDVRAMLDSWCGAVVAQEYGEIISAAGGGHADYTGNFAVALAMRDAVPAWRQIAQNSPASAISPTDFTHAGSSPYYTDGYPRSMHNGNCVYGDGKIWYPMMNAVASDGGDAVDMILSFDRASLGAAATTRAYDAANLGPWHFWGPTNTNTFSFPFGVGVFDRVNHNVYCIANAFGSGGINSWKIKSNGGSIGTSVGTVPGSPTIYPAWAVCAYDLGIIVVGDQNLGRIAVLDIGSNTWSVVTNTTGAFYYGPSLSSALNGVGAVYYQPAHQILVGNPNDINGDMFVVNIPVSAGAFQTAGQWAGFRKTLTGGPSPATFARPGNNNFTYGRWNIIEDMGNGQSALVYVPSINGAVFVFKIPLAGVT